MSGKPHPPPPPPPPPSITRSCCRLLPGWSVSPSQVDETNYLDLEVRANRGLMHPPPFRRLPFKFHTDDEVVLKRTKQQLFKDKVSLTGYDVEEPRFPIQDCSY